MQDTRFDLISQWTREQLNNPRLILTPASGDASFRRYFRTQVDEQSYILMDAPPEKEDCESFVKIAQAFRALGLNVPEIIKADHQRGFLLLSDLGNIQYLAALNANTAEQMYGDAMQSLLTLQLNADQTALPLPPYNADLLWKEMSLFGDWFLRQHMQIKLSADQERDLLAACKLIANEALSQPQVWVHRDYHSRNLMVTARNNPGILDFQDAVLGPITYDLVSLLRDCYISWPVEQVIHWVDEFRRDLNSSGKFATMEQLEFQKWFDYMGIQRHMKAIGIFSRLQHRDEKAGYLKDIPRTLNYVLEISHNYSELAAINQLIHTEVTPLLDMQTGQRK